MAETVKTGVEKLLDQYLKGLMLPEEISVNQLSNWLWLLIAVSVLLAVFGLWRWRKRRNALQQIARRNLKQLQGFVGRSQNRQTIAVQLSTILRQGLGVTRLELYQPDKLSQWQTFLNSLETASYSAKPPSLSQLEALFIQSNDWLKQA